MRTKHLIITLTLLLATTLLCSCGSEDDPAPPVVDQDPIFRSPGLLMEAFLFAYEEKDHELLRHVLHPDFVMFLQNGTQQEFPDLGPTLDVTEEMRIAERMFSGVTVINPNGLPVAPVAAISFQVLEQQGLWADTGSGGLVPNAQAALFDTGVAFDHTNSNFTSVQGGIKFFIVGRDTVINGEALTAWTMIGQQDLTLSDNKAVEHVAWGKAKALYY